MGLYVLILMWMLTQFKGWSLRSKWLFRNPFQYSLQRLAVRDLSHNNGIEPASKLVEHMKVQYEDLLLNKLASNRLNKPIDSIVEGFVGYLVSKREFTSVKEANSIFHQNATTLLKAINSLPEDKIVEILSDDSILNDKLDVLINEYQSYCTNAQQMFFSIRNHHKKLTQTDWNEAMKDIQALSNYSSNASIMGRRVWVREGNKWMANFTSDFYRYGGAAKFYNKQNANKYPNLSKNLLSKGIQGPEASAVEEVAMRRKIKILDIGSCYNPLASSDRSEDFDIVAIDLFPADDSVLKCDFLQLEIGEKDSEMIIEEEINQLENNTKVIKHLKRLPRESFDAVTLSLVLSYLPTYSQREEMIAKAHSLLKKPSADELQHPHYRSILLILEKESIFNRRSKKMNTSSADDPQSISVENKESSPYNQTEFVYQWKNTIREIGFDLVKYTHLKSVDHRTAYVFVFAKNDQQRSENHIHSESSTHLYISHDFITKSDHKTSTMQRLVKASLLTRDRQSNSRFSQVGIIGGGLAGTALALALQDAGISYTLFERDESFSARKQGYAFTIQQGSSYLRHVGLLEDVYREGVASRGHYSYQRDGSLLGAYAAGTSRDSYGNPTVFLSQESHLTSPHAVVDHFDKKRLTANSIHNIHISRQKIREIILEKIHPKSIQWGKRLSEVEEQDTSADSGNHRLHFSDGSSFDCTVLVGADGIFSAVRECIFRRRPGQSADSRPTSKFDLRYLDLLVILGISSRRSILNEVFCQRQWLDGQTRIFTMPFDRERTMWQLSFPASESEALAMSGYQSAGERRLSRAEVGRRLKNVALERLYGWDPVLVDLIVSSDEDEISGHPVYDREPRQSLFASSIESTTNEYLQLQHQKRVTLIGDAFHPMSPFKAQGANQALLDALFLTRALQSSQLVNPRRQPVHEALRAFELEMATRSEKKVRKSKDAAVYLHSPAALAIGNITRAAAAETALTSH